MKFDAYTIKARLFPFLLLIAPAVSLLMTIFSIPFSFFSSIPASLIMCIALVVSIFIRNRGKTIEAQLWNCWGGPPTTRFLRYNNDEYNSIDKKRCHEYFRKHLPEIQFPTEQYESQNPLNADEIYSSCISFLRTKSRNKKKYPLVYSENSDYGFLRNSLGIKTFGIVLSCLTLTSSLVIIIVTWINSYRLELSLFIPIAVSIGMLIYWVFFITKNAVKISAENYAMRLLEVCLENEDFTEEPILKKSGKKP